MTSIQPLLFWIPFALFAEAACGGAFRYADVPSAATVGRVFRRAWWLGAAILTVCGLFAAARVGVSPAGALSLIGTIVAVALHWRYRPAAAPRYRVPAFVAGMRLAMGKDGVTDGLRWRRALVLVGHSAVLGVVVAVA